ncbi:MAG: hypothetical protein ACKESB_03630 [Candidatus Hodgkinia cicadicola]
MCVRSVLPYSSSLSLSPLCRTEYTLRLVNLRLTRTMGYCGRTAWGRGGREEWGKSGRERERGGIEGRGWNAGLGEAGRRQAQVRFRWLVYRCCQQIEARSLGCTAGGLFR